MSGSNKKDKILFEDITVSDLKQLCQDHDIGKLVNAPAMLSSTWNLTRKITTTKGSYVIKQFYNPFTDKRINFIQDTIYSLNNAGIKVPAPIINKTTGQCYSQIKQRIVQVTPFINSFPFKFMKEQIFHSGTILRKFHDTLQNNNDGPPSSYSTYPSLESLLRRITDITNIMTLEQKAMITKKFDAVLKRLNARNLKELPHSIIHCDWHFWNQLYTKNGEIIGVIDLDKIQRGERIHDVATALYYIYKLGPIEEIEKLSRHFLKGYGPLETKEKEYLPIALARVCLYLEKEPHHSKLIDSILAGEISF
ncbi:phosphotransferase [Fredinandcohnia onubensis]|uniref:phosphotransferase n=1 Tax=Fredinandcohnia onubensis TaxID=1571209 RepID=UPI0015D5059C|nr:phosphotransferase [Fredinandcohnia onubensis]